MVWLLPFSKKFCALDFYWTWLSVISHIIRVVLFNKYKEWGGWTPMVSRAQGSEPPEKNKSYSFQIKNKFSQPLKTV